MDLYHGHSLLLAVITTALAACGEVAQLPVSAGFGPHPRLPPPNPTLIPTVNIAQAVGWPANGKPQAAPGMTVNAFAGGLDHPRWLYVLPNGDVLAAETNAPPRPKDGEGIKGWIVKWFMNKAGSGAPSANRVTLLRDADCDGVAETRAVFLKGLNSPFGMALIGNDFYVANTDALVRFPYTEGETRITQPGIKVLDLPAGPINHHWTKNLLASRDGLKLYVTVGSNSNAAENGIDQEAGRAAIWEVDPKRGSYRIYASGLRNPNGLAWESQMVYLAANGYRCIAHDRRGHGRSSQPWNGNGMDTYADDLSEFIETLALNDITLVGHSTGGGEEVARYIGRHGSQRVAKIVMIGSV